MLIIQHYALTVSKVDEINILTSAQKSGVGIVIYCLYGSISIV